MLEQPGSVKIPQIPVNNWDIFFKSFWTLLAIGGGAAVTVLADAPVWWALPVSTVLTAGLAWMRQRFGVTAPDLPARTKT